MYGQNSDSAAHPVARPTVSWPGASLAVGRVLAVVVALSFSMGVVGLSTAQAATPRPLPVALSSWQPTVSSDDDDNDDRASRARQERDDAAKHGHDNGKATPCDRANQGGCANNGRNGGYDDDDD